VRIVHEQHDHARAVDVGVAQGLFARGVAVVDRHALIARLAHDVRVELEDDEGRVALAQGARGEPARQTVADDDDVVRQARGLGVGLVDAADADQALERREELLARGDVRAAGSRSARR
jgi:hypothetical protein